MRFLADGRLRRLVAGSPRSPRAVVAVTVGVLVLASGAFLLGFGVGLSSSWVLLALAIALATGWFRAGVGPTVGSLWLIGLWWFVFPPLVGYLTGAWTSASRYNHPRMLGFAYETARAELLGGLEYGLRFGLLFAVLGGLVAYGVGAGLRHLDERYALVERASP